MKKVFSMIAMGAFVSASFIACGPSQAELEAIEKAKQDSIAAAQAAEQARLDSIAAAEAEAAALEQARLDSIAAAEAAAAAAATANKPKGSTKPKAPSETNVKVDQRAGTNEAKTGDIKVGSRGGATKQ